MRNFFTRLFPGRRGPDAICGVLFGAGLVLSAIAWFTKSQLLGWLVYLPWLLALLRMFSRSLERRYQENARFVAACQRAWVRVRGLFDGSARTEEPRIRVADTAQYHHFACPACGQKLRVPRGRGKVMVTCPRCARTFIERS